MANTFICTQGTSIANPFRNELSAMQKLNHPWESTASEAEAFRKQLFASLTSLKSESAAKVATRSAELTILGKKHLQPEDRVVLLATDTYLGKITSEALRKILTSYFKLPEDNIVIERIVGLQVKDKKLLEESGVGNFFEITRKHVESALKEGHQVYLCPNGGFKGIVPFLTYLGMLKNCKVLYTFEFSESVIELPSLPFTLDTTLFKRAETALKLLTENIELSENEFLAAVENYVPEERELFLGFVQSLPNGRVTPSAILETLIDAAETHYAMLSTDALKDLEKLQDTLDYEKFITLILRAQDSDFFDQYRHPLQTTDLIAIKQGNTNERLLGYLHGGLFYVARILKHDDYNRLTNKRKQAPQKKDYPLSTFHRWEPEDKTLTTRKGFDRLKEIDDKRQKVESENQTLTENAKNQDVQIQRLQKDVKDLQKECTALTRKVDTLQQENAELQSRKISPSLIQTLRLWWKNRNAAR